MSSDENFFMVVVRFLETFVGSMSAGLFLAPCRNLISLCIIFLVYGYVIIPFGDCTYDPLPIYIYSLQF